MSWQQTLLKPVASLAAWQANRQLKNWLDAHHQTAEVQQAVLNDLVSLHAPTGFGRDHDLGAVRTVDDFRRAVPISSYDRLQPYIQRVLNGETTALLPPGERVMMFSMTSGTTGEPKYIPVTRRFLEHIRRGWNIFGLNVLSRHDRAWLRPIVQISSSMREQTSPTGLACGAISGLLAATQKRIVQWMYVVPRWVTQLKDPTDRFYAILRSSIAHDVAFITTANPSSTLKLIEVGRSHIDHLIDDLRTGRFRLPSGAALPAGSFKIRPRRRLAKQLADALGRDGDFYPHHAWDLEFLTNWTGGTLGLYVRRLKAIFGQGRPVYDIGLLASEGRFSIPLQPNDPAGVAEITGNLLEFIPAEQHEEDQPETLLAHQLDVGREYFLVISNYSGLLRYNLDDRVRVVAFHGRSPVFEFLCRGVHTANMTGEKVTEHQVVEAMRRLRRDKGLAVERFVLQGCFPREGKAYYELRLETRNGHRPDELAEGLDQHLQELNIEYASKRQSDRLGPIRCRFLARGVLEQIEREQILARRGRSEQYKHQYLLTEILET